jgi:methylenetetrahydrofolate dehydrogenase(NAD+)/5,10-methenyltetrahydrofolate cyclohydrolase
LGIYQKELRNILKQSLNQDSIINAMANKMRKIFKINQLITRHIQWQVQSDFHRSKATVIGGPTTAIKILDRLAGDIEKLRKVNVVPKLVPIVVGNVAASQVYIKHKVKAAAKAGLDCQVQHYPNEISQVELLERIEELNEDSSVHGIIVQLPLPNQLDEHTICNAVTISKDVDGFTTPNLGRLVQGVDADCQSSFVPCTPLAVLKILQYDVDINFKGLNACVAGRSHNVGMPIAMILAHDAIKGGLDLTTTICHRYTPPEEFAAAVATADVIVTAAGVPSMVTREMVKPGVIIVDVGINSIIDPHTGKRKLVGDVHPDVAEVAGWMTPVPGGVGPCTVACLLHNTVLGAKNAVNQKPKE